MDFLSISRAADPPETGPGEDRASEQRRHRLIHQRVPLDEVERGVRQSLAAVGALTGPQRWHLEAQHGTSQSFRKLRKIIQFRNIDDFRIRM